MVDELHYIEDSESELETIYWHILDHARNDGDWTPPIRDW